MLRGPKHSAIEDVEPEEEEEEEQEQEQEQEQQQQQQQQQHGCATWLTNLILLDFIARTILAEQYRSLSSSLCSFLHSPVTSSLLAPNILLNTLFSNTISLRSLLNVSDQVPHPYKQQAQLLFCIYNSCIISPK